MGDICPPQSVNKNSTPRSRNTCPMMSPLFISMKPPMASPFSAYRDRLVVRYLSLKD
jgi:hypothetical protein